MHKEEETFVVPRPKIDYPIHLMPHAIYVVRHLLLDTQRERERESSILHSHSRCNKKFLLRPSEKLSDATEESNLSS